MEFLVNLLSVFSVNMAEQNARYTALVFFAEPECPKDLL